VSAGAPEASGSNFPEFMSWDDLERLPGDIAGEIELWNRRVVWNKRGPMEHQRFMVRMHSALESNARRAMQDCSGVPGGPLRWQVGAATNVFFAADKSSYLTPDFLIRQCLPRGADTAAADVSLVGEVLSRSDDHARVEWKKARYAEGGIPWYWEVELDSGASWDISVVRVYELVQIPAAGLAVKPLRPATYILAGEWEPGDAGIEFPEPFQLWISWEDLAF
jgi:hypothetical protein